MATVKQVVTITKGRTKSRVSKVSSSNGKKGNPNRCPTCGRFR